MKWLVVAASALLLQACGGGGGAAAPEEPAVPQACSVASQRESLRAYMQDKYYWYTQLRTPNEAAETMDGYFQSMLVQPPDRYSFTESTALHNQIFTEGKRTGYGYVLVWGDDTHTALRVRNVEPLSPVARAGLARGDTIISIDGYSPEAIAAGLMPVVTTAGVPRHFVVRHASGVQQTIDAVSEEYPLSPVLATATFDAVRAGAPVKVGYVAYNQFVGYSTGALGLAFTRFGIAGVTELILDLRYNGGGSVNVSRDLAGMIGGARTAGQLYAYLRFNDKQANSTQQVRFNTADVPFSQPIPAGLQRVVVITSGGTASASELVINGLRPYIDVVLVGETTYGKPYGFVPRDECGVTYNAVQFESLNAAGVGGYTAGFAPDCQVADDLEHPLADASERRIQTALGYIATGSCGAASSALGAPKRTAPAQAFGETLPNRMFVD